MKKIYIKTILAALLFLGFKTTNAQCVANCTFAIGTGGAVTFTSTSTGTSSNTVYYWTFGDGNTSSTINNIFANNTYTANGTYNGYLFIYDTASVSTCSAGIAFSLTITNAACSGSASFANTAGPSGLENFNSTSTGIAPNSTYFWNFGDGNTANTGTSWGASHTYTAGGSYTVTMVVTDPLSICSYTAVQTISVTIVPCSLVANYTFTNSAAGLVNFTSTSTGTTANTIYSWDFGDFTYGSGATVSHTYASNGNYNVNLNIMDSIVFTCSDTITKLVPVTNVPCLANSTFSVTKDSSIAYTWKAFPAYSPNILAANWNWGDGNNSTGLYPSHTYSAAGFYSICLSVTVSCTSGPISSTTCVNTNIWRINANDQTAAMISINVINPTASGISTSKKETTSFNLYPNPNNGEVNLQINNSPLKDVDVAIYNMIGENVYKSNITLSNGSVKTNLNLNELNNGTYFIRISGQATKKLIVLR